MRKSIVFTAGADLQLKRKCSTNSYEQEVKAEALIIEGDFNPENAYILHIAAKGEQPKAYAMETRANLLRLEFTPGIFPKAGIYYAQLSAAENSGTRTISNIIRIEIQDFINGIPGEIPETEISIIEQLLNNAQILSVKAHELETLTIERVEGGILVKYDGNSYEIHDGRDGEDGHDYVLTDADKSSIAELVVPLVDTEAIEREVLALIDFQAIAQKAAELVDSVRIAQDVENNVKTDEVFINNLVAKVLQELPKAEEELF